MYNKVSLWLMKVSVYYSFPVVFIMFTSTLNIIHIIPPLYFQSRYGRRGEKKRKIITISFPVWCLSYFPQMHILWNDFTCEKLKALWQISRHVTNFVLRSKFKLLNSESPGGKHLLSDSQYRLSLVISLSDIMG